MPPAREPPGRRPAQPPVDSAPCPQNPDGGADPRGTTSGNLGRARRRPGARVPLCHSLQAGENSPSGGRGGARVEARHGAPPSARQRGDLGHDIAQGRLAVHALDYEVEVEEAASGPARGWQRRRRKEVKDMELLLLEAEYLPVMGSLVAGGVLFATVLCAFAYGWFAKEPAKAAEERKVIEFKKAA